jgi:hypothetical protein
MPGPVSDSYDPEFGTGEAAAEFREHLQELHRQVGSIIGSPPIDFRKLPNQPPGPKRDASFCERDWRFIRFALETAADCI